MIWLQEYGTKTGANRPDYKLFYCENDSDVAYAPTLTEKGNANYYVNKTDSAALDEVKVGDIVEIKFEAGHGCVSSFSLVAASASHHSSVSLMIRVMSVVLFMLFPLPSGQLRPGRAR